PAVTLFARLVSAPSAARWHAEGPEMRGGRRVTRARRPPTLSEAPAEEDRVREHRQQPAPLVSEVRVAGETDDAPAADALGPQVRRLGKALGHLGPQVPGQPQPIHGR